MTTWTKIGEVGVDSGQLMVADPCYFLADEEYDEACAASAQGGGSFKSFFPGIVPPIAVAFPSGFGDGRYDVLVRKTAKGRIAEVRIVMITQEEETAEQ